MTLETEIEEAEDKEPMLRWVKWWKQPPPIQKMCHPRPNTLYTAFRSIICAKGTGTRTCGALAFFLKNSHLHFRRQVQTDCLAEGRRLPKEEVLFPLFVLLLLEQSRVKVQPPLRHMARFQGSGTGCLLHKVKTSLAPALVTAA